jgi:hypothetical protein
MEIVGRVICVLLLLAPLCVASGDALITSAMASDRYSLWAAHVRHPDGHETVIMIRSLDQHHAYQDIVNFYCIEQLGYPNDDCIDGEPWKVKGNER